MLRLWLVVVLLLSGGGGAICRILLLLIMVAEDVGVVALVELVGWLEVVIGRCLQAVEVVQVGVAVRAGHGSDGGGRVVLAIEQRVLVMMVISSWHRCRMMMTHLAIRMHKRR